jgi:hypothetical protein
MRNSCKTTLLRYRHTYPAFFVEVTKWVVAFSRKLSKIVRPTQTISSVLDAGIMGFSAFQNISSAMRVIAYGIPADYTDEYIRIGQDTTMESVRRFSKMVMWLYGDWHLWAPNKQDTKRLMEMNEKRGWSGMLDSLECMHWTWKNCLKAWHGMYCSKSHDPTIVLEVVASEDLWIWQCIFWFAGNTQWHQRASKISFICKTSCWWCPNVQLQIMDNEYTIGYYLTDGIYLEWATLVKSMGSL